MRSDRVGNFFRFSERWLDKHRELEQKLNALRGADWLVITTSEVLKRRRWGIKRLEVLRERNDMFRDLYPLADHLRAIWKTRDPEMAEKLLNAVVSMLMAIYRQYGFLPAKNFAGMLKRRKVGIITAGLVGLGTNILEGVNNKAKVIKRVAFGFRDFPYFCLKLKAACVPSIEFPQLRHKSPQKGGDF